MLRALSYVSHACVRERAPSHMQPISIQKACLFTKGISARPMHTAQASIAGTRAATLRYRTQYNTQGGIKNSVSMATNTTHRYAHTKVSQGPHNTRLLVATTAVLVAVAGMVGATVLGDAAQAKEKENTSKKEPKEKPKSQDWRKKYTLGKRLGEGTFGTVYLAVDKATKARYAIKILKKRQDKRYLELLENEILIMEAAGNHPFIVSLVDKYDTDTEVVLVMDLVTGGELFDRVCELGRLTEKDASVMLRQVCEALRHLHSRGICHNDVKPENLLLTSRASNASLKLVDFGTSIFMDEPVLFDKPSGTAAYRSPETICHQPSERSIDMWAFGIVMYIMLCGAHPFDISGNSSNAAILVRAVDPKLDGSRMWPKLSESARDLLTRLLDPNPETRITAKQALDHPWLGGTGATDTVLPVTHMDKLRHSTARRKFRVAAMTIGTSNKTDMDMARKFYTQDPDYQKACDRSDNKYMPDIEVFKDAFNIFDKDGDGSISANELDLVFRALGQVLTAQELKILVAEADLNGDGVISIDEFIGMMARRIVHTKGEKEENIKRVFEIFDRDGSGKIDRNELVYVLNEVLDQDCSEEQIEQIIKEADLEGDGEINYQEFNDYLFSQEV